MPSSATWAHQKILAARITGPFDGCIATAINDDMRYSLETFLCGSMDIAVLAGRDQVFRIVVLSVIVQVIHDEGTFERTLGLEPTDRPIHQLPAPVARMWAWPDSVVQHETMYKYFRRASGIDQRVPFRDADLFVSRPSRLHAWQ
jgi:hypothetical protein